MEDMPLSQILICSPMQQKVEISVEYIIHCLISITYLILKKIKNWLFVVGGSGGGADCV